MSAAHDPSQVSAESLERTFESTTPFTVGLEEEVMLLDPETLDLRPCAPAALERVDGDGRFKAELPASQLEILTEPCTTPERALAALADGRRDLASSLDGLAVPAVAGVHPFAASEGKLSTGERYDRIQAEFGPVARRQLVSSLQVHVAVGGADRTLAVYNALRCHLPEIAALAANAAYYEGRDTGMASIRPGICELLPRQGLPPAIASWEEFAAELLALGDPRQWWWELRPHPAFGTLEVRVPDAQTALADAAGVVAFVHALVARLAAEHDRGRKPPAPPTSRILENRGSAARHGVEGEMADLDTGELIPTRERLSRLIDELGPTAERLGTATMLLEARRLASENGALAQRHVAETEGARGLTAWMADRFTG